MVLEMVQGQKWNKIICTDPLLHGTVNKRLSLLANIGICFQSLNLVDQVTVERPQWSCWWPLWNTLHLILRYWCWTSIADIKSEVRKTLHQILIPSKEPVSIHILSQVALSQQLGAQPLPFPGMDKSGAAVCEFYVRIYSSTSICLISNLVFSILWNYL